MLTQKELFPPHYHGGLDQDERERALIQFRNGSVSYLITTDLGARGLIFLRMNSRNPLSFASQRRRIHPQKREER